jgi:hypothetical protein
MDDIILLHKSKEELRLITLEVIDFLQNLGWRLSLNKCVINPRMTFQYLDWQFRTAEMTVTMTNQRRRTIKNKIKEWIKMTYNK